MAKTVYRDYELDDDIDRIDWARVHAWLTTSYWSPGVAGARVERAGRNSTRVLGAFRDGVQVGYLRVLSDRTRIAYLADVWVDVGHRRQGLAKAMVAVVMGDPDLATVTWLLATKDAHDLYRGLGFDSVPEPARWMSCPPRDAAGNLS